MSAHAHSTVTSTDKARCQHARNARFPRSSALLDSAPRGVNQGATAACGWLHEGTDGATVVSEQRQHRAMLCDDGQAIMGRSAQQLVVALEPGLSLFWASDLEGGAEKGRAEAPTSQGGAGGKPDRSSGGLQQALGRKRGCLSRPSYVPGGLGTRPWHCADRRTG